jgi:hypothetical protein
MIGDEPKGFTNVAVVFYICIVKQKVVCDA